MLLVAHDCITHHVPYVHVGAGCVTRGAWDQTVRDMLTQGCAEDSAWAYTYDGMCQWAIDGYGVPILDTLKPRGLKRQDYLLVAVNPVTAKNVFEEVEIAREIGMACMDLDVDVVWSRPNEDPDIDNALKRALAEYLGPMKDLRTKGKTFADALEECRVIVGNSSAALIEAPVLGTPYVDCGCRQEGRPLAQGLRGIAIRDAIANAKPCKVASPYQHPERRACQEIIRLCEEVVA
jgi:hypothetical protein